MTEIEQPVGPSCWQRLDAQALAIAQLVTAAMPAPVRELGAQAARQLLTSAPRETPITPVARVEEIRVPTRAGSVRARRYVTDPGSEQRPALLYLHGGGFVLGTLDGADEACRALSVRSGWDVLSLEYRLAPEHPYPSALEDSLDALMWLRENAASLAIDPSRIAIGGDSAGGNLAAATCLYLRDHALPTPVAQILVYPATDDSFSRPSWIEFADAPILTTPDGRWLWEQYVSSSSAAIDEYAAPLRARSHCNLPPAVVLTAEVDPLRDDAEAYAAALSRDDVPVTLVRHRGIFHGFFTEVGVFPQTEAALDDAAAHLRKFRQ